MTDAELAILYRAATVKALAILRAAQETGTNFRAILARLDGMGIDAAPGLKRAMKVNNLQKIRQEDIDRYLRKHGKAETETDPQAGCIDETCADCRYLDRAYGYRSCAYLTATGHRRGCPAGKGCKRYESRRSRPKGDTGDPSSGASRHLPPGEGRPEGEKE